jgi:DNA-binding SARP family transcriptional activator
MQTITVDVLGGTITKGEAPVAVGARERAIVMALAVHRNGLSRERLADLIYADSASASAADGIKVYVHRLRRRVAPEFVLSRDRTYALGPAVRTPISDGTPQRIGGNDLMPCSAADLERLRLNARNLRSPVPSSMEHYEWYVAFALNHQRVGRQLALNVAHELARRHSYLDAIQVATELTFEDPCDEEAWEEIIRCQLAIGQRSAALHGFRFLRSALEKDLGMQPSGNLIALLSG